jgi:prevent-host-death family protein
VNTGKVVSHAQETHRPVLLTRRGRGVAVVRSLKDYEEETEARAFMKGVVRGLMDLEEGREISLAEAKKRLGLKQFYGGACTDKCCCVSDQGP